MKCLNPQGKIATPNIDRLAAGGMIFTDAHACFGRLHAVAIRHSHRPLQLALAAGAGRADGSFAAADRAGPADGSAAAQAAWLSNGLHRQMALGDGLAAQAGRHLEARRRSACGRAGSGRRSISRRPIAQWPATASASTIFSASAPSADMPPFAYIENDRCHGPDRPRRKRSSARARPSRITRRSNCCPSSPAGRSIHRRSRRAGQARRAAVPLFPRHRAAHAHRSPRRDSKGKAASTLTPIS